MEIIEIEGRGFKPLKDYNCWRIAHQIYDQSSNSIEMVRGFGRHLETDEVFILLEGQAYILTAGFEDSFGEIEAFKLSKNKLYTVKEKQWHSIVLVPESKVLIVENKDTSDKNSQSYDINEVDRKIMIELIKGLEVTPLKIANI